MIISTADAAAKLGVSAIRVRQLIARGRLPATLIGRTWAVDEKDLAKVKVRKPGRPPKPQTKQTRRKK